MKWHQAPLDLLTPNILLRPRTLSYQNQIPLVKLEAAMPASLILQDRASLYKTRRARLYHLES
jgi:hypothetical protein